MGKKRYFEEQRAAVDALKSRGQIQANKCGQHSCGVAEICCSRMCAQGNPSFSSSPEELHLPREHQLFPFTLLLLEAALNRELSLFGFFQCFVLI